jgi:hypothetical protein
MTLNGIGIDASMLPKMQTVFDELAQGAGSYTDLEDIRNRNHEIFGNELMWNYPTSASLDVGSYIVAVKEGFLSLPYNNVETETYESFQIENAYILDEESLLFLINQWRVFSKDLLGMLGDALNAVKSG